MGFASPTQASGDGCPDPELPPSSAGTSLDVSPSSALPFCTLTPNAFPAPQLPNLFSAGAAGERGPHGCPVRPSVRACVLPRSSLAPRSSPVSPGLSTTATVRHTPASAYRSTHVAFKIMGM